MSRRLEVALIDVGGTLWPNSWPIRQSDGEGRRLRVRAAMSTHDATVVDALVDDLLHSSRPGDEARSVSTETPVVVDAVELIGRSLTRQGLSVDVDTVTRIRRAMAIPVHDRFRPLPGAKALLETIHELGLRTFITSNTYWRDADSYREDFGALGMGDLIDGIVTSIDAGRLKPHPAVFEMATRLAGVDAEQCVVIGNREDNDIAPALALGMRTILVYPDDPEPATTRAHAVAPDLLTCAAVLREMIG